MSSENAEQALRAMDDMKAALRAAVLRNRELVNALRHLKAMNPGVLMTNVIDKALAGNLKRHPKKNSEPPERRHPSRDSEP